MHMHRQVTFRHLGGYEKGQLQCESGTKDRHQDDQNAQARLFRRKSANLSCAEKLISTGPCSLSGTGGSLSGTGADVNLPPEESVP